MTAITELSKSETQMRVMICGSSRNESQANAQVRQSIVDGWVEYLSEERVISVHKSGAASVIRQFQPDLVLVVGSYLPESTYFGEISREMRYLGKTIAFWATEDPYEFDANYRIRNDFDAIFSCDRWATKFYRHPNTFHLPLAGCHRRHYIPIDESRDKTIDVMFCGVAFSSRQELIEDIRPHLVGLKLCIIGPGWGKFGAGFSDRRIDKSELIDLYGQSKVVLNLGRSLHFENNLYKITPSTPGPRTFEAALAGAVQFFHEDTYEIRRYFHTDEIPCFSNPREFASLLLGYLSNSRLNYQTATLAQKRALSEHTYYHRAQSAVAMLRAKGLL